MRGRGLDPSWIGCRLAAGEIERGGWPRELEDGGKRRAMEFWIRADEAGYWLGGEWADPEVEGEARWSGGAAMEWMGHLPRY